MAYRIPTPPADVLASLGVTAQQWERGPGRVVDFGETVRVNGLDLAQWLAAAGRPGASTDRELLAAWRNGESATDWKDSTTQAELDAEEAEDAAADRALFGTLHEDSGDEY